MNRRLHSDSLTTRLFDAEDRADVLALEIACDCQANIHDETCITELVLINVYERFSRRYTVFDEESKLVVVKKINA